MARFRDRFRKEETPKQSNPAATPLLSPLSSQPPHDPIGGAGLEPVNSLGLVNSKPLISPLDPVASTP